ncbi:MAG TPA: protein kinase [Polyangiaceae bacterium]|nr:protein kinase [Polyangiaceae bacterium]
METTARARTLGKYKLIAELGRGGMGIVYLAVAQGPGGFSKLLVIKELRPELAGEPAFLHMFLDEARLAARLNHPNVVQTYEVGEEGGHYFMAMEYLEGQTLQRTMTALRRRGRTMPHAVQLRALSEVLLGLHYAHELRGLDGAPLGVVHRDVSPHNIFLTYDGQIKLVDFGIAKALDAWHETVAGTLKGKVTYMAPEQVTSAASVDRRVDVFAAGAILWEALVGRKLWDGVPVNEVLLRLTRGALPPPPAEVAPAVPAELDRLCTRAMAADREARFPTALAFRDALEEYMQRAGEAVTAHEVGRFVAELFADERVAGRSLVEAELNRLKSGVPSDRLATLAPAGEQTPFSYPSQASPSPASLAPAGQPTHHSSLAFAAQPGPARGSGRDATRRTLWLALGVVVASASITAGATIVTRGKLHGPTAPPAGAARAESLAAESAPAKADEHAPMLAFNVRVTPPSARVFLDDEELTPDARASVRPRDRRPHRLYAEAEGYLPRSEIVLFDGPNVVVNLTLDKRPAQPSAAAPPAPRGRAAPPPPSPPRPAPPPAQGEPTINTQGGKPPKRAVDPWNPYGG